MRITIDGLTRDQEREFETMIQGLLPKGAKAEILHKTAWRAAWELNCGRMGSLSGEYLVTKEGKALLDALVKSKRVIYFGEVLAQHSDIRGPIDGFSYNSAYATPYLLAHKLGVEWENGHDLWETLLENYADDQGKEPTYSELLAWI